MEFLITTLISLVMAFSAYASEGKKEITLSADNTLILDQAFDGPSTVKLMEQATKMNSSLKSGYPMYLFLYTPGGSIQAGLELYEFLGGLNRPVHTITLFAASMGFQTVQHLGNRYIVNYGVLMSHYPRGGSSGAFGGTNMPSKRDSYDNLWKRRIDLMDQKTVERTKGKQTVESYRKAYMFDLWLNGQEAVEQGYADEVVTVKCDSSLSGTRTVVEDYGFVKLNLEFSQCPVKTYPVKVEVEIATNQGFMKVDDFIQKNGQFGDNCLLKEVKDSTASSTYSSNNYYYTPTKKSTRLDYGQNAGEEPKEPVVKEKLCVQDKTITLESVMKKKDERVKWYTRDLKDHIVYSY